MERNVTRGASLSTPIKERSMLARVAALAVFVLAPVFPALAQPSAVAEINFQTPKSGMSQQYEAARKKHNGWHKSQKDAWSWYTWEVVSGPRTGTYVTGTFGHDWKDFDTRGKFNEADLAEFQTSVGPSLANAYTSYYVTRADISLTPPSPGGSPAAMSSITLFHLKPDSVNDFIDAAKKINEGIKKTNYAVPGPSRWFQLVNGGEGPLFVLSGDRANWAAFQANEKTLDVMMEEAYGKEQGAATLASLRKAVHTIATEIIRYRPDLSYVPAK